MMRRRLGRFPVALVAGLLVAASLFSTSPATAELEHPRQRFLRDSQAGLLIHWGLRTSPQHTSCAAWENDVTNGGGNARYWVDEAKKPHAQYIVLATFHSRLGYARPWPSAVPGSCRTDRDFLGELVSATNAAGMRTILYLTDDPQWWNEGLPSGRSWLDSDAYSDYKGHDVDLHTRDGFGEYSYDLFVEVMRRYPDLAGFWIDNDNAYWERNGLYELVRSARPNWTLSNNNEDTPIMDMISNEQKTGMSPAYDYPQAVYTAAPRLIEADYKLPVSGAWRYDGSNPSVDHRVTLGRYITNAGSSTKSLMAETAQVNGRFPGNQEAFDNVADSYLDQIWDSVNGTEGGGYAYGGLKPGFWNDGAHGVTTVCGTDPDLHFVHVVTRPSGALSGRAVSASCGGCSGGAKVGFIGHGAANHLTFTVRSPAAGPRQLTFDCTVDGTRTFFVSANNAPATEIPVSGTSWQTPTSHTVTVPLVAGANTIRFAGDGGNAPDLDRITLN